MVTHDPELAIRAQREVHIVDGQVVDLAAGPRLVAAANAGAVANGTK
jgi:putative ABC transport system ATP-binding protein